MFFNTTTSNDDNTQSNAYHLNQDSLLKSNKFNIRPCNVILNDLLKPKERSLPDYGDGKLSTIFKCKSKRCEFKQFQPRDRVFSSCIKRIRNVITPPGT